VGAKAYTLPGRERIPPRIHGYLGGIETGRSEVGEAGKCAQQQLDNVRAAIKLLGGMSSSVKATGSSTGKATGGSSGKTTGSISGKNDWRQENE